MTAQEIKVVAYAEHCAMQGRAVSVREIENHEDGEESRDFVVYTGTAEELLAQADELDRKYRGSYRFRLAKTIREAVYWERPDLKPEPETDDE